MNAATHMHTHTHDRRNTLLFQAKEALDIRRSSFAAAFAESGPLDADALNQGLRCVGLVLLTHPRRGGLT